MLRRWPWEITPTIHTTKKIKKKVMGALLMALQKKSESLRHSGFLTKMKHPSPRGFAACGSGCRQRPSQSSSLVGSEDPTCLARPAHVHHQCHHPQCVDLLRCHQRSNNAVGINQFNVGSTTIGVEASVSKPGIRRPGVRRDADGAGEQSDADQW